MERYKFNVGVIGACHDFPKGTWIPYHKLIENKPVHVVYKRDPEGILSVDVLGFIRMNASALVRDIPLDEQLGQKGLQHEDIPTGLRSKIKLELSNEFYGDINFL
jgi:hypothetical protein